MRIPSGTTDQYIYFVAVDATDFTTRETGLSSFTVYRSRNGGAAAAYTTPTINETDSTNMPGVYELLLDEDMTIDAGDDSQELVVHITHAGMAPVTRVVELYRPKATVGETLTVTSGLASANATQISGDATAADNLELCFDGTGYTVNANVVQVDGTAAATALATDASIADAVWAEDIGSPTLNSVKQYLVTNIPDAIAVVDGNVDSVLSDTTAILADTGTDGVVVASASTTAIASAVHVGTIITGTADTGATSTLIPFSAIAPTLTVADQLVGRVLIFKTDTSTAELRGQAATISASTTSSISVISAEAFTTAPASGDTFVVV